MNCCRRILILSGLVFFIFLNGVGQRYTKLSPYQKEYYLNFIKQCENISHPGKKEKCQRKFLKYFNSQHRIWFKKGILKNLDPVTWNGFLRVIAEKDKNFNLRLAALNQLKDWTKLSKLVDDPGISDSSKRSIIHHLDDQENLKKIYRESSNDYLRQAAVEGIYDQNFLITLARKEQNKDIRYEAAKNLKDTATLRYLFENDLEKLVRKAAGKNLEIKDSSAIPGFEELSASDSLRLEVDQDLGKSVRLKLPVRKTIACLLHPSGMTLQKEGDSSSEADFVLRVNISGSASSRLYTGGGVRYTGVRISGSLWIDWKDRICLKKEFKGEKKPPRTILKISGTSPNSAPFRSAFSESDFKANVIEILCTIHPNGDDLLEAYMTEETCKAKNAAVKVLAGSDIPAVRAALGNPLIIKELISMLKEGILFIRSNEMVLTALGKSGDPLALKPILNFLKSKYTSERIQACKALGGLKSPEATNALFGAVDDNEKKVRLAAIKALGYHHSQKVGKKLASIIVSVQNDIATAKSSNIYGFKKTQKSAIQSLEKMPEMIPLKSFLDLAALEKIRVLIEAGLKAGGDKSLIINHLKTKNNSAKFVMIEILGKLKAREAIGPLIELLRSKNSGFRRHAHVSLMKITGKDFGKKYRKWKSWWNKNRLL